MSDSPRRASTALFLVTVLIAGLIGAPSARADDGATCDPDPQDESRTTPTAFTVVQAVSAGALDWFRQTLNSFRDGLTWVRSYVRALVGRARV